MDIDAQAAKLHKKLDKLNWQLINNPDLTKTKRQRIEDEVNQIKEQLKAFEAQLTPLTCAWNTPALGGYPGGTRAKPSWGLYWESRSMNRLTWPTDCTANIQWVGQDKGLLADKSSAALNKQIDTI